MQYGIKDACDVYLLKRANREPVLFSEYANSMNLSFESERSFARARGVNKIAFDSNRSGSFKTDFEVFDLRWIAILLGAEDSEAVRSFIKREVLTVDDTNKISLQDTPKTGTLTLFTLEKDKRTHIKKQELGEPATVPDAYSITDKDVTLNAESCPKGTLIAAYYMLDTTLPVRTFTIKSNKFPENYIIDGQTEIKNEFGTLEFMKFEILNCTPKSNMEISFATDNVATVSAEFDLLADENNEMATISIIKKQGE